MERITTCSNFVTNSVIKEQDLTILDYRLIGALVALELALEHKLLTKEGYIQLKATLLRAHDLEYIYIGESKTRAELVKEQEEYIRVLAANLNAKKET